jgi:polyisoprenoid-binding protein YceI
VRLIGEFLLAGLLVGHCWAQAPGSYSVDAQSSHIEIRVFRGGLLGGLGDNHVVVLRTFSGTARASAGEPWHVHVVGDTESLRVLDPGESPSTREQVQQTILGATVLDGSRYKTIELQSRSLTPGETDRSWRMHADLTLHGLTRQVEFLLSRKQDADRCMLAAPRSSCCAISTSSRLCSHGHNQGAQRIRIDLRHHAAKAVTSEVTSNELLSFGFPVAPAPTSGTRAGLATRGPRRDRMHPQGQRA